MRRRGNTNLLWGLLCLGVLSAWNGHRLDSAKETIEWMHHDGWHGVVDSDERWILGMQQESNGIRYWCEHDDDHHRMKDFMLIPEERTVSGILEHRFLNGAMAEVRRHPAGVRSDDNTVDQSERVTMLRTSNLVQGNWHSVFTFAGSSLDQARIHALANSPEVAEIQRRLGMDIESHYDRRPVMDSSFRDEWQRQMQSFAQELESHAGP